MIEAHPVRKVYAGSEFSDLASTLPGRGAFLCRCRDKRCRWRHAVHADVSIGARRVNCSSSDEKRTRTPDGVPMAAWARDTLSYLYYQPPQNSPPYFFSRRPPTTARGRIKAEGRHSLSPSPRPSPASEVAISLLSSLSSFFLSSPWKSSTSTPPSEQPTSASPSLHCTSQTDSPPPVPDYRLMSHASL